jgi:RNA methyltransferase, TrmH family
MLSRAEVKRLRALAHRAGRAEAGLFLAEGVRLVEDLLDSRIVPSLALVAPSLEDTPRGLALARRLRAAVRTVAVQDHELARIADTETPQGIVVAAHIPRFELAAVPLRERELVVVADAVQDPGNFGTIARSADAFGAGLICLLPGSVDPWNPKAVRSAAGSSLRVPIVEVEPVALLEYLRSEGFRALGAAADGASVADLAPAPRTALVLGNEGAGVRPELRQRLDGMVSVPLKGGAESLNVGVAAGILLYLLSREI